jgi:hypothetical protein
MQKNLHMSTAAAFLRRLHVFAAPFVTGAAALMLGACTSSVSGGREYVPPASRSFGTMPASPPSASDYADRPGLGTTLGHEYTDRSQTTRFYRRNSSTPDAVGSFHYNDKEGAKAMSELAGSNDLKRGGTFRLAGGKLRAALETWDGPFIQGDRLPWYESDGRVFVIGESGRAYSIVLENPTRDRLEVVVSVDGLDVLSGTPASVSKRGYVIAAGKRIEIDGMKVNGKMRRFQFGSVRNSQAARSGGASGARNVGVVGVAVYVEDEAAARMARIQEGVARGDARAFPGN